MIDRHDKRTLPLPLEPEDEDQQEDRKGRAPPIRVHARAPQADHAAQSKRPPIHQGSQRDSPPTGKAETECGAPATREGPRVNVLRGRR